MNWINYDELKLMNEFFAKQEAEWKKLYGFSHSPIGDYFKIEYISTLGDKRTIHYSTKDEKKKLQAK